MDGIVRDASQYDRLESLIKQRRYEDSLILLNEIIKKTPQDSDAYLYRSLVTRIVALREFCQNPRERQAANVGGAPYERWMPATMASAVKSLRQARQQRLFGLPRRSAHDWGFRLALAASVVSMATIVTVIGADLLLGKNRRLTASAQTPGLAEPPAARITAKDSEAERTPPSNASPSADAARDQLSRAVAETESAAQSLNSPAKIAKTSRPEEPAVSTRAPANLAAKTRKKKLKSAQRYKTKVESLDEAPTLAPRTAKEIYAAAAKPLYYKARRPITIRQAARFAAPALEKLSEGTLVQVIGVKNSWAKIQLGAKEPGFVRIEFLGPAEIPTARGESFARLGIDYR